MRARITPGRRWLIIATVLGVAAVVPAVVAQADDMTIQTICGDSMDANVSGGAAHWDAECDGNTIEVSGWVKDTAEDGKCARVKAYIDGKWKYSKKACPSGETQKFKLTGGGKSANVYLYVK